MKKLLCTLLCAALLGGTAAPALAAESADARLAKVTQAVKTRLGLDTEEYESFHGSSEEQELATLWSLEWSGQNGSLSIEALEDGTVVSYRLYEPAPANESGSIPSFPAGDSKAAVNAANDFLKKALNANETIRLGTAYGEDQLGSTSYRFSGEIQLNGLPSPLSYSLTVRADDGRVTRFWRDVPDTVCLGGVPGATASISAVQAAESLKKTQTLRLEYVLADSGRAVLRYVPDDLHTFYVDARTGEAVDLTELQKGSWERGGNGMTANDAAAPEAAAGLSEAEQDGIRKLEGVLDKDALDAALQAVQEFGLGRYTLNTAAYRLEQDGDSERVLCTLRYSRAADEGKSFRTVTVDARTGEVLELWSSAPWNENRRPALSVQQAQERAEAFLKARYGAHYETLALYDTVDSTGEGSPSYSFTFARRQNDIFFPANAYTVGIDAQDGSVSCLSFTYDESVEFDSTDGLVSAEAALDAWMGAYEVTLRYLLAPEKLDRANASAARLIDMGMTHFNAMKLGYMLECEQQVQGVDAKTGEPVLAAFVTGTPAQEYADLTGHWAKDDIERLARFGVGYSAERFQPDKALTQLDAVCLLASLQGYRLDPENADAQEKNQAYSIAYGMGALIRQQRQDGAVLTRGELVKLLLNGAGYEKTASLKGIFTCSYADRASIAEADLGYAALAQGLGLIRGSYNGAQTATRAEAAIMLVRLMQS